MWVVHFSGWSSMDEILSFYGTLKPLSPNKDWAIHNQPVKSTNTKCDKLSKISSSHQTLPPVSPQPLNKVCNRNSHSSETRIFRDKADGKWIPHSPDCGYLPQSTCKCSPRILHVAPKTPKFCCGMFSGANADGADGEGWIKAWLRPPGPGVYESWLFVYRHSRWSSSMFEVHNFLAFWNFWNLWNTCDLLLGSGEASIFDSVRTRWPILEPLFRVSSRRNVTVSMSAWSRSIRRLVKLDRDAWEFPSVWGKETTFNGVLLSVKMSFILSSTYKHVIKSNKSNITYFNHYSIKFIQSTF